MPADTVLVGATVDVSDFGLCFVSAEAPLPRVAEVGHVNARGVGFRTQDSLTSSLKRVSRAQSEAPRQKM